MNNVVIISTHIIGEGPSCAFPKHNSVYSQKLAEYFKDKYGLKKDQSSDSTTKPKSPEELFSLVESIENNLQKEQLGKWNLRIKKGESVSVVKEMCKTLENQKGDPSAEIIAEMKYYLEYEEKKKRNKDLNNCFTEEEAGMTNLPQPELPNRTLRDISSFYRYQPDSNDKLVPEYLVYAVMELKKPEQRYDDEWKWVKYLEEAIKEQHKEITRIILLLHDQDLKEYSGQNFQCVDYNEEDVSIAIFQHSDLDIIPFFSGRLSSKQLFEELDSMISVLSKMRECYTNVGEGYKKLIEEKK